ncbi:MAG: Mrp/NBP35 family ATP-binding protein [candidate division WS1 bacterium]|nr:Mrp/NBP35 family ATP-binding protein [candidate division WS1 bacterium]
MNDQVQQYEQQTQKIADRMGEVGHVILVLSGKGGVGKSTVAANLASALAERGNRVGLMDADLHGPTIPLMMGVTGEMASGTPEALQPVEAAPNLAVMSIGFLTAERDQPTIWRGPLRGGVLRQFLGDVEWGQRDFLVVDLPPGTGDEPLTLAQSLPQADGAIIVTTPQEASLADCRKAINFAHKVNLRVLGVVENMSGFVCPHCGERTEVFSTGGGEAMARQMNVPFLGRVPLAAEIVALSDEGKPLTSDEAPEAVRQAWNEIVDALMERIRENG